MGGVRLVPELGELGRPRKRPLVWGHSLPWSEWSEGRRGEGRGAPRPEAVDGRGERIQPLPGGQRGHWRPGRARGRAGRKAGGHPPGGTMRGRGPRRPEE